MKKLLTLVLLLCILLIGSMPAIAEEEINLLWNIPFGCKATTILDGIEEALNVRVRMDFIGNLIIPKDQELWYLDQRIEGAMYMISDTTGYTGVSVDFSPLAEQADYLESDDPDRAVIEAGLDRFFEMADQLTAEYGEPTHSFIAHTNFLGKMYYYAVPMHNDETIDREALIEGFLAEKNDMFFRLDWNNIGLSGIVRETDDREVDHFGAGLYVFDSYTDAPIPRKSSLSDRIEG